MALGVAFTWALWRRRPDVTFFAGGLAVGLLPMWRHLVRAGPVDAIDGMLIDPVVRLRPGRELPRPPSWGQVDGALQAVAESLPPWWRFPAIGGQPPAVHLVLGRDPDHDRRGGLGGSPPPRQRVGRVAPATRWRSPALFGLGILPQALQRPDSTHLAWVGVVSWSLAVS